MIARGFRPVGWIAAVTGAALGCYMLSLQVAAERADLAKLDRRIIAARQSIRSLQTELGTRGRIQQLEEWNDEVLALAAPVSDQFVEGSVSLARFDTRQPQLADREAEVRLASAEAPAAAPAPAPAPAAQNRAAPAPQHAVAAAPAAVPPMVRRASLAVPPPAVPTLAPTRTAAADEQPRSAATAERPRAAAAPPPAGTAATEKRAPATVRTRTASTAESRDPAPARTRPAAAAAAPRQSSLLGERTMRDLRSTARTERERGTVD